MRYVVLMSGVGVVGFWALITNRLELVMTMGAQPLSQLHLLPSYAAPLLECVYGWLGWM